MKNCKKCNKSFSDDVNFCNVCGEKLQIDTSRLQEESKKNVLSEKVRQNPLNAQLIFEYANYLFEIANFRESLEESYKVIAIDENYLSAKILIIKCLIAIGDVKNARELAENYHKTNSESSDLKIILAEILRLDNDPDIAIQLAESIIENEPDNLSAKRLKAVIYSENGNYISVLHLWNDVYNANKTDYHALLFVAIASFNHDKNNKTSPPIFESLLSSIETDSFYRLLLLMHNFITYVQKNDFESASNIYEELKTYRNADSISKDLMALFISKINEYAIFLLSKKEEIRVLEIVELFDLWGLARHAIELKSLVYLDKSKIALGEREFSIALEHIKESIKYIEKDSILYNEILITQNKIKDERARYFKKIIRYTGISLASILIIVVIVKIFSFFSERVNWKETQNKNTIESYQLYI